MPNLTNILKLSESKYQARSRVIIWGQNSLTLYIVLLYYMITEEYCHTSNHEMHFTISTKDLTKVSSNKVEQVFTSHL